MSRIESDNHHPTAREQEEDNRSKPVEYTIWKNTGTKAEDS